MLLADQNELHVRALCDLLGQSQPAVSHHLALLRSAGLIESRRDGKHNFYRIEASRFSEALKPIFDALPNGKRRSRSGAATSAAVEPLR